VPGRASDPRLPFVAAEDCFVMKGGTAINLFVGDLPRLSVDIDLTWHSVASCVQLHCQQGVVAGDANEVDCPSFSKPFFCPRKSCIRDALVLLQFG